MGGASDYVCLRTIDLNVPFSTFVSSQITHKMQDCESSRSLANWILRYVLQGELYITYEVFQTLCQLHTVDGRSF